MATDFDITAAMIQYGGSFVQALGKLYRLADSRNQARLKLAFPDYWKQYTQFAQQTSMHITGDGNGAGPVHIDGVLLDPAPSQAVFNHSPDGFAWGYGGSGPAQLALAILLHAGVLPNTALALHQRFKAEFLATLERSSFGLSLDVLAWVETNHSTTAIPTEQE